MMTFGLLGLSVCVCVWERWVWVTHFKKTKQTHWEERFLLLKATHSLSYCQWREVLLLKHVKWLLCLVKQNRMQMHLCLFCDKLTEKLYDKQGVVLFVSNMPRRIASQPIYQKKRKNNSFPTQSFLIILQ